jgi:Dolichyl-phosphate-mannose-protein mannosyltransferase
MTNPRPEGSQLTPRARTPAKRFNLKPAVFPWLALLLVGLAILHSASVTRLDGFTIDEAYHIAAGVSYTKYYDFRMNPEHPPLVKLWVGSVVAATGFRLDSLRPFNDKPGERAFANVAVFRQNDPDSVQRRARVAMFGLNGLLLLALAFALERVFNAGVSIGALLFLTIDPTVSAHLPVVMTDLPLALLSTTAVVFSARAFREWRAPDLAICSTFLGLALATKDSAPVVVLGVVFTGALLAVTQRRESSLGSRWRNGLKLCAVVGGAMLVLWASYFFRYSETPNGVESFNRPLQEKINDVSSPRYHSVLVIMEATHMVPRAYLWGFADTIRAGLEGRESLQLFFGRVYRSRAPRYFFPAMIAVKLPIGLIGLILLGLFLFASRRLPPDWTLPCALVLASALIFLLILSTGATYAGIRHALPVVVLLAVFAGVGVEMGLSAEAPLLGSFVGVAVVAAAASTLPQMRPWEYFNEFVGGTTNAYKSFSDEGVNLGQRSKELAKYYNRELKPLGLRPVCLYWVWDEEKAARGIDCLGNDEKRDAALVQLTDRSGTIFGGPSDFIRSSYWDAAALRESKPAKRFGNLYIFKGTFHLPGEAASDFYWKGINKLYGEKPDDVEAEKAFRRSVELDPRAYFVQIELGNIYLKRQSRDESVRWYSDALRYAPQESGIRSALENQIFLVSREQLTQVSPMRDPHLE